ncbi:hypothetical protein [Paenibacillus sp. TH7-28]
MLDIQPIKSTTHPTIHNCIDDVIFSVALWLGRDCKYMYGNAWKLSFAKQRFPDQPLIECVSIPQTSMEYLAAYHGINLRFVERDDPAMDKTFMLNLLETRLAYGMPILLGFDSYSCPWCKAYKRLHTSHACLAIGLDRSCNKIYLMDAYYGRPMESLDFDYFEQACHFYGLFTLCDDALLPIDRSNVLRTTLASTEDHVQPSLVGEHIKAYADAYLETDMIISESPEYMLMRSMKIPISRARYSIFLEAVSEELSLPALQEISVRYQEAAEQWLFIHQWMIKCLSSGNKPSQRKKVHKKMFELAHLEEQLLHELADIASL